MKKNKNVNFIVYIHIFLFAVAVIFYLALRFNWSLIIPIFAIFNFVFLFINIPLAITSFILKIKGLFSRKFATAIIIFSILNSIVGILVWYILIVLLQKP